MLREVTISISEARGAMLREVTISISEALSRALSIVSSASSNARMYLMREAIIGNQTPSEAIRGNQRQTGAIRRHQRLSEAIMRNQTPSEAIRGLHANLGDADVESDAIRGHQAQSEAIGRLHANLGDADVPSLEEEGNAALDAGVEHILPVEPPDPVAQPLQRGDAAPEALDLGRQSAPVLPSERLGMGRAQQGGMLGIVCLHTGALRVEPSHLAVELLDGVGERGDHLRFESVHRRRHREPSHRVRRVVVEQRRQQRKLGQRKELALDEVVRRREHEPKLPSVRVDRLLLERTGGSERRAVTQYRPKSQRVLHVIKEPNLQAQEASESAGLAGWSTVALAAPNAIARARALALASATALATAAALAAAADLEERVLALLRHSEVGDAEVAERHLRADGDEGEARCGPIHRRPGEAPAYRVRNGKLVDGQQVPREPRTDKYGGSKGAALQQRRTGQIRSARDDTVEPCDGDAMEQQEARGIRPAGMVERESPGGQEAESDGEQQTHQQRLALTVENEACVCDRHKHGDRGVVERVVSKRRHRRSHK
eukprot:jgi/Chrpa1/17256/Chrysochromulina_OHIO_Genome00020265-RA